MEFCIIKSYFNSVNRRVEKVEKRRTRIILIKIVIHEEQKFSIKNKSMEEKRKKLSKMLYEKVQQINFGLYLPYQRKSET